MKSEKVKVKGEKVKSEKVKGEKVKNRGQSPRKWVITYQKSQKPR